MVKYQLKNSGVPFTQIPNELIRSPELSASAKAVYCYMAMKPNGWSFYLADIINNMKEGRDRVKQSLKELCNAGWLSREQIRVDGQYSTNDYTIYYTPQTDLPSTGTPLTGTPSTANQPLINKEDINTDLTNKDNKPPIVPQGGHGRQDYSDQFDEFWIQYPRQRRGNRQKAYKAYCTAILQKRGTPDEIYQGCLAYGASEEVRRGYAKGCTAWLNGDKWADDYTIVASPAGQSKHSGSNNGKVGTYDSIIRSVSRAAASEQIHKQQD